MFRLTVTGHLGKDATVKQMESGKFVTNFSVAYTKKWKDQQGAQMERTTWVSCSYWTDRVPGIAPYLLKGQQVLIEGEPEADYYNSGQQGLVGQLKCRIANIELLGSANRGNSGGQPVQQSQGQQSGGNPEQATPPDDLPF